MAVLDTGAAAERMKQLHGWQLENGEIVRTFSFADFVEAMRFVNAVAEQAEVAGHHPDIDIRYNKVKLALISHDAGGLTENDFRLATKINALSTKL